VLDRWDFHRVLRSDADVAITMLASLSHRLRKMSNDAVLADSK
jgi:hypothetical protein